jgi:hypothetical protein
MSQFYIHIDDEQKGPFSLEELKAQQITRDTMVWFEGADNWKKAGEVAELKEIFTAIPPPLQKGPLVVPPPLVGNKNIKAGKPTDGEKTTKKSKMTLVVVLAALVLVGVVGVIVYSKQQGVQPGIQRQIEEQNARIQQQADIEAARSAEEEKQKEAANAARRQAELQNLKYEYDQAVVNLRAAKIRLNEIQQFQLLRTASEKQQQVQAQLESIRAWENEVERLRSEMNKY